MSVLELVIVAGALLLGRAGWVLWAARTDGEEAPPLRRPVPWLAMLLFLGLLVPAAVAAVLGGPSVVKLVTDGTPVAVASPEDIAASAVVGALLLFVWLGLPIGVAIGSLLVSARRSVGVAAALAASAWVAAGIGGWVGLHLHWLVLSASPGTFEGLLGLLGSVRSGAEAMARFGLAAAVLPLVAIGGLAARTRSIVGASLAMPAAALAIAAVWSPPDVVSQIRTAVPIGMAWTVGLAVVVFWRTRPNQ